MSALHSFKPWLIGCFVASTLSLPIFCEPTFANNSQKSSLDEKTKKTQTVAQALKNTHKIPGFLNLYQNQKDGSLMWRIKPDQLNQDFLHFVQIENGLVALDKFKGEYRASNIYRLHRHFDKVEVIKQNSQFYFDKKSPLYRAANANINTPVVASEKIIAEDKKSGDIVIKADGIFLTESLHQITPSKNPDEKPGSKLGLGTLNKDKTRYNLISGYPDNTNVVVEYNYDNPAPVQIKKAVIEIGDDAVTDERHFRFKVIHSFVKAPKNGFTPRKADPRVGYFTQYLNDMTSLSATPYKDVINRWHLVKKDKSATLSEPLQPITWWIENTTPMQFRETIKQAVLEWNKAFELAGFKNAMEVKVQPDNATWDAGDIRYNVLRWTSSPKPVFSGYGPSFADPRTGQILGADIMLEFGGLSRRLQTKRVYELAAANDLYSQAQFGVNALMTTNATDVEVDKFIKEFLYYLILHEVGHTLGLNHNMKASQLLSPDQVHDMSITKKEGITASIMDYPAINFAPKGKKQGQYYSTTPGAYDLWVIEYGYSEALSDFDAEKQRLNTILSRSSEPALAFGNDADDMRQPGKAIDPLTNIYDMSSDAVTYAQDRLILLQDLKQQLLKNLVTKNESYQSLTNGFITLHQEYSRNLNVISRYIGGVTVDRSFHLQTDAKQPFTPIAAEKQKQAMKLLRDYAFAPATFENSSQLLSHLQQQRRGFDFYNVTEDPKLHELVLGLQKQVLDHLLHPVVLNRITDSSLYGNEYSLQEVFHDLTESIFAADAKTDVESYRQNLQVEYTNRLIGILTKPKGHNYINQSLSRYYLKRIKKMLRFRGNSISTMAHKQHIEFIIDKALDVNS